MGVYHNISFFGVTRCKVSFASFSFSLIHIGSTYFKSEKKKMCRSMLLNNLSVLWFRCIS